MRVRSGKRIRVITDEVKYRRHQRKKILRMALRFLILAALLVIGVVVFWVVLGRVVVPPPHD